MEQRKDAEIVDLSKIYDLQQKPAMSNILTTAKLEHSSDIREYDPDQPPDFELASKHGLANKVYRDTKRKKSLGAPSCPCCKLPIQGELIPLNCPLPDLFHLGKGVVLYFQLLKYCIALLVIFFFISGLFNIITNVLANDCEAESDSNEKAYCVRSYITIFTIANKRNSDAFLTIQMCLNLAAVVACILFFQYMHYRFRQTVKSIEQRKATPSLYTIKVFGLDPYMKVSKIREWIEGVGTKEFQIKCWKIHKTYSIDEYVKLIKKKTAKQNEEANEFEHISKLVLQREIEGINKEIKELLDKGLKPASFVYISFERVEQAIYVLKKFHKAHTKGLRGAILNLLGLSKKDFYGQTVLIEKAPEPADILWENQTCDPWDNFKRVHLITIVAGILFIICVVVVTCIQMGQNWIVKGHDSHVIIILLSIIASALIYVIDYILARIAKTLVSQEKHTSCTSYFVGTTRKISAFQFTNTALAILLAKIILFRFFEEKLADPAKLDSINFFGVAGLLESMFYVFLLNAILTPVLIICNPLHLIRFYRQKKALENKQVSGVNTQKEANEFFEAPQMDFPSRNASVVKTVLVACFFAPAAPFALILAILGLFGVYWTDKFVLLRRAAVPIPLSDELNKRILRHLKRMTVMFAGGNIIFIYLLKNKDGFPVSNLVPDSLVYITLALSIALVILPTKIINRKLFKLKHQPSYKQTYKEANFRIDYDTANPIKSQEMADLLRNSCIKEEGERIERKDSIRDERQIVLELHDDQDKSTKRENDEELSKKLLPAQVAILQNYARLMSGNMNTLYRKSQIKKFQEPAKSKKLNFESQSGQQNISP